MPRIGFIDHIGIGVPDLAAAKRYYDELMAILGLRAWFPTTAAGEFNYGPDGARGPQIFFYQALEPAPHSRHGIGLQHLSFMVSSRHVAGSLSSPPRGRQTDPGHGGGCCGRRLLH